MQFHECLTDRQPQAKATELASDLHAALLKKVKDTREPLRRNANPVILYLQFPLSAHLPNGRYSDSTVPGGEFDRVSQQVQKHLLKPRRIRRDPRRRIMKFGFQMNAFFMHL